MNKRSFLGNLVKGLAGFAILPAATTYARDWKFSAKENIFIPSPEWVKAPYEYHIIWASNPWTHLLNQGTYPPNMGETRRTVETEPIVFKREQLGKFTELSRFRFDERSGTFKEVSKLS